MENGNKDYSEIATNWQTLRSQLYLHHHGICWICHEPIELQDYEIGHLVDRCNGGQDVIENLAPMHKWCNNSKPKHNTLEEHITWLLKTKWLDEKPSSLLPNTASTPNAHTHRRLRIKSQLPVKNQSTNEALSQSSPNSQNTTDSIKLEVIKLLGKMLDMPTQQTTTQPRTAYPSSPIQSNVKQETTTKPILDPIDTVRRHRLYKQRTPRKVATPRPTKPELLARVVPATICWIQGRPLSIGGGIAPMWKVLPPPYRQEDLFTMRETPPGAVDNGMHSIRDTLQIIDGNLTTEVEITLGFHKIIITPDGDKPRITFASTELSNNGKRSECVGMGKGQIPISEWNKAKEQGITLPVFKATYRNPQIPKQPSQDRLLTTTA